MKYNGRTAGKENVRYEMASESAQAIIEHYQKTFELTHEMWKERNKLFVNLVLITGVGLLFLLRVPEFDKLLVEAIANILGIENSDRITELYTNFPFDVLLSTVLVIIFYLMQKLYSTNLSVSRYYLYLGAMEAEIRKMLELPENSVAFTREGKFYWSGRTITQDISKWLYVIVITITLLPFSILKIFGDLELKSIFPVAMDITVSLMTLVYLLEYARSTLHLDVAKLPPSSSKEGKKSSPKK